MKITHALGALAAAALVALPATAASVLLKDGEIHTQGPAGTLKGASILIVDGRIRAIGAGITAPADAEVIDLHGRPVTPSLFGGVGPVGLVEVGGEDSTHDATLKLGQMRPEFDPAPAFNPDSVAVSVARVEGVGFTLLVPGAEAGAKGAPGSSVLTGAASLATLDGHLPSPPAALQVVLGEDSSPLDGGSRAAAFMLLSQAFEEARSNGGAPGDARLLTPAGRRVLARFLGEHRTFLFGVNRASDIRATVAFAEREKIHAVILGGAEAWRVGDLLARSHVPVVIDPLEDLPASYDRLGSSLENAARLAKAGATVAFSLSAGSPNDLRKLRQAAGNAVAHGLDWDTALAAVTRVPAEVFGAPALGSLAVGQSAALVVWSGDPLEVTSRVDAMWLDGQRQSLATRQTLLRDRYFEKVRGGRAR